MIDKALIFLRDRVKEYFVSQKLPEDFIELSHLVDDQSKVLTPNVGITLINIQEERKMKSQTPYSKPSKGGDEKHEQVNPELKLNFYIMFTAKFGERNYTEALKFISKIITYFQMNNSFTPEKYPDLDDSIQKLNLELYSPGFEEQNRIWGTIGAKYLPSAIYLVRLVVIQGNQVERMIPSVEHVERKLANKSF